MAATLVRKVMLRIAADDGDTEAKLDAISAKADELAEKHPDLKVKIDTAAASAKLAVLRKDLKETSLAADGLRDSELEAGAAGEAAGAGGMSVMAGAIAGLIGLAAAVAPALLAAGAAFGAFALFAVPAVTQVTGALGDTKAQLGKLPEPVRTVVEEIKNLEGQWKGLSAQFTLPVDNMLSQALGDVSDLLPKLIPLAKTGMTAVQGVMDAIGRGLDSKGFAGFMSMLERLSGPATSALIGLAGTIGGVLVNAMEQLAPYAVPMIKMLQALVAAAGPALIGALKFLAQVIMDIGTAITPVLGPLGKFFGYLSDHPVFAQIVAGIIGIVVAVKIFSGAMAIVDAVMGANPFVLLATAIALVAILIATHTHQIAHAFDVVRHAVAEAGHDIAHTFDEARRKIASIADGIWHDVTGAFDKVRRAVTGPVDAVLGYVRSHWKLLSAIILGPIGLIIDALATHWSAVEHGFEAAYKFVAGIVAKGIDFIRGVIGTYVKWSEAIFHAGWDAVKAVFTKVWAFIRPFVDMEVRGVKNILSWFGKLGSLFRGWWDDAVRAVSSEIGKMISFVEGIPGRVNSALGGLPGMMYRAGVHVIENLLSGITSKIGSIGSVMGGVASKVAGFFGLSPAKEGPLSGGGAPSIRGQHFALDIAHGMMSGLPAVSASASHVARAAGIGGGGRPGYGAAAPGGSQRMQLELNITGGNQAFRTFLKKSIRTTGGDVSVVGA